MEFKSQIATSREQSEQLLALGLKPETADMVYHERISKLKSPFHKHPERKTVDLMGA